MNEHSISSSIKQAQTNKNKRLSRDEKALLLVKAVKRTLILKQKQHLIFTLQFLK
jgi:hypothetical protein